MQAKILFFSLIFCLFFAFYDGVSGAATGTGSKINIDALESEISADSTTKKPGWLRRSLYRFGEMASNVGNSLGSGTTKLNSMIEKLCQIMKMIMPVVSAVCQVGQFKFCAAAQGAPEEFVPAMTQKNINFDAVD